MANPPEGSATPPTSRRSIGRVLVADGLLTEDQLQLALAAQQDLAPGEVRQRLGALVTSLGFATEYQVAEALAKSLCLDLVDLRHQVVAAEHVTPLSTLYVPPRGQAEVDVTMLDRLGLPRS